MKKISFSVVIPFNRNNRGLDTILKVIKSCQSQSGYSGALEIIVVNNLEDTQTQKELTILENVRVLTVGELGVNKARNLGVKNALGEKVLFLDDDCVLPDENYLARLEKAYSLYSVFAGIGGGYKSDSKCSWRVSGYNKMASEWAKPLSFDPYKPNAIYQTNHLLGGNACYRKEIFNQGYYFDEELISGGDESEFNARLVNAGFKLGYSSDFDLFHLADKSWRALIMRAWNQGAARPYLPVSAKYCPTSIFQKIRKNIFSNPSLILFCILHFPILHLSEALSIAKKN